MVVWFLRLPGRFSASPLVAHRRDGRIFPEARLGRAGKDYLIYSRHRINARGIAIRTQRQTLAEGAQSLSLPVTGLPAGAYFVKAEANGESVYQKLMVGR